MTTIHRFCGTESSFDWEDVLSKEYAVGASKGASGKVMIGKAEGAPHFAFRYFCIQPGGHSTLNDHHAHEHGVMILHGRALLTAGDQKIEVGPRDIVYIEPWEYHSFAALGDEPLGFLCVIPNKELLDSIKPAGG
jgi:quercetin dioxygenase-like cupin family protein